MGEEEERLPDSEGVTQPRPTERGRIPSPPLPGSSARGRTSPEPALLLHQGGGIANVSQGSHVSLSACTCAFVPVCFGDKCRVQLFLEVPRRHPGSRKVGLGGGQRACGTKVLAQNQVKPGFSPPAALLQLRKPSRPPYQTEENPPTAWVPVQPCHVSTSTFGHMALLLWSSLCHVIVITSMAKCGIHVDIIERVEKHLNSRKSHS